jgi:hypothetical protein
MNEDPSQKKEGQPEDEHPTGDPECRHYHGKQAPAPSSLSVRLKATGADHPFVMFGDAFPAIKPSTRYASRNRLAFRVIMTAAVDDAAH